MADLNVFTLQCSEVRVDGEAVPSQAFTVVALDVLPVRSVGAETDAWYFVLDQLGDSSSASAKAWTEAGFPWSDGRPTWTAQELPLGGVAVTWSLATTQGRIDADILLTDEATDLGARVLGLAAEPQEGVNSLPLATGPDHNIGRAQVASAAARLTGTTWPGKFDAAAQPHAAWHIEDATFSFTFGARQ
ncbi:MAG TPA: hypothetical protein VM327_06895 [Candidatus Thermoplasmatota archaeon]|nr:hypothetical protein [Candidatus Thermoplasmatota archaeon]